MATTVKQLELVLAAQDARIAGIEAALGGVLERLAELEAARQGPSEAYRASTYAECRTPEARAAYLRDFRRNKKRARDSRALKAPVPGESPTTMEFGRRLVARVAEELGLEPSALTFRGGYVYHGRELIV